MLAVQRQVVAELVDDQADDEAHVGAAALQHTERRGRTVQRQRVAALDHGAHVLDHDVAAGALCQAVTDLLTDDLVLFWLQTLGLGVGNLDDLHGHLGLVEERRFATLVGEVAAALAALVRRHGGGGLWGRAGRRQFAQQLTQVHLLRLGLGSVALALLAEQLAFEPIELVLQRGNGGRLQAQHLHDVVHRHRGHRLCGEDLLMCACR